VLRHLDGPDKDILTREEVCQYLRIEGSHLDSLIKRKEFPRGVPYGDGRILFWMWEDVWAFRHLRMRIQGAPELPEETAPPK
jgi:predicted DNA-binding transcriptional regulator AlpA